MNQDQKNCIKGGLLIILFIIIVSVVSKIIPVILVETFGIGR